MAVDANSIIIVSAFISFAIGFLIAYFATVILTGNKQTDTEVVKIDREFKKLLNYDLGNEVLKEIDRRNISTLTHEMFLTEFLQYWNNLQPILSAARDISTARHEISEFRKKFENLIVIGMNSHGEIVQVIYNLSMNWMNKIEFSN